MPEAGVTPVAGYFDARNHCRYVYDFGDDWQHTVVREAVVELDERFHGRLVDGARASPPEDCRGIGGYEQCVAVARGQTPEEACRVRGAGVTRRAASLTDPGRLSALHATVQRKSSPTWTRSVRRTRSASSDGPCVFDGMPSHP